MVEVLTFSTSNKKRRFKAFLENLEIKPRRVCECTQEAPQFVYAAKVLNLDIIYCPQRESEFSI